MKSMARSSSQRLLIVFAMLVAVFFCPTDTRAQVNPIPLTDNPLVPTSAVPGGGQFTLTVNGTGFVSGSVVNWNGNALSTAFVSSSQLTAIVPALNIATAGTASVTVINSPPGGGESNVQFFVVRQPFSAIGFSTAEFATAVGASYPLAADVNHDGKFDILSLGRNGNTNSALSVLLGNGDGTFLPHVDYTLMWGGVGPVIGDFNGDGNIDYAENDVGGLAVLLGNGDGTFHAIAEQTAIPSGALTMVAADFNRDGKLDLALAIMAPMSEVLIALGNGDGTFENFAAYLVGSQDASGMIAGDFNRDGLLDLAVELSAEATVAVLLGNGDGTFQGPVEYSTPLNPYELTAGDFNKDGKLDLAVQGAKDLGILIGNGDGTFQSSLDYRLGNIPLGITSVDFNGDGDLDLATPSEATNSTVIYLGNGEGKFKGPDYFNMGRSLGVASADFNNDGKLDLVSANSSKVIVLLQANSVLSKTFVDFRQIPVGSSAKTKATLSNIGPNVVTISSITIGGSRRQFRQTNNCGSSLAPGASCKITLAFVPKAIGDYAATVKIVDSEVNVPQTIDMRGRGN